MTLMQDITAAALLGSERQPFAPPAALGELGDLLARLPADPEGALLGAAAAVWLAQRAGTLPPSTETTRPEPCPVDDQPVCSPRVAQGLSVMLGGSQREALPEMLLALAATGRRVPEPLLPELLQWGRQCRTLRDASLLVIGRRGRWLAAQNRDWAFADQLLLETAASSEQVWQEGSREARLTVLQRFRQTDPTAGLALLQSGWATETADDRAAFLSALETGLSLADEPFLETALEDRGKEVRRVAAELLARLPDSELVKRMIARAEPLLVGKRGLLGGFSLEITLPSECDKGMERDGIAPKPAHPGMGEKAWWLSQIVGAIPPAYWTQTWRRKPEEIIAAADKTEWAAPLLRAWQEAAARQADHPWTAALIHHFLSQKSVSHRDLVPLLDQTPGSDLDKFILEALREAPQPLHDAHIAVALLSRHTQPWSVVLSRAVVESLQQRAALGADKEHYVWQTGHHLRQYAFHIPPALREEFSRNWPEGSTQAAFWQPHVHEFMTTLQFRHDLLQEIFKETRP